MKFISIVLLSILFSCNTSNNQTKEPYVIEAFSPNINETRKIMFDLMDSIPVKVISDEKYKESKKSRRNKITFKVNQVHHKYFLDSILHESEIKSLNSLKEIRDLEIDTIKYTIDFYYDKY